MLHPGLNFRDRPLVPREAPQHENIWTKREALVLISFGHSSLWFPPLFVGPPCPNILSPTAPSSSRSGNRCGRWARPYLICGSPRSWCGAGRWSRRACFAGEAPGWWTRAPPSAAPSMMGCRFQVWLVRFESMMVCVCLERTWQVKFTTWKKTDAQAGSGIYKSGVQRKVCAHTHRTHTHTHAFGSCQYSNFFFFKAKKLDESSRSKCI